MKPNKLDRNEHIHQYISSWWSEEIEEEEEWDKNTVCYKIDWRDRMGAYYDQAGNRTSESIDEDMNIALSRRRREKSEIENVVKFLFCYF